NGQVRLRLAVDPRSPDFALDALEIEPVGPAVPPPPGPLPLLHQANLQYLGAFRLPAGTVGASTFDYGGTAIAFKAANNSLFIVGHPYDQAIAEVAIPQNPVNSSQVSQLPTAAVLQAFVSVLPRLPNVPLPGPTIGGLMVVNGQLLGT